MLQFFNPIVRWWNSAQHRWIRSLEQMIRSFDLLQKSVWSRSELAINLEESLPLWPNVYLCDSGGRLRSIKQRVEAERNQTLTWSDETTKTCCCTTPATTQSSSAFTHSFHVPFGRRAPLLLTENTPHIKNLGSRLHLTTRGLAAN